MCDRLINIFHCLHRQDIIQILSAPVLFCCFHKSFRSCTCFLITTHLYMLLIQARFQAWQECIHDFFMDHQRFTCVAHTDPLCLCIENNINCHIKIGTLIHKNMAVACASLDHRYPAVLYHTADQSGSASGNQYIHILVQLHKCLDCFAAGIFDQLYCIFRNIHLCQCCPDDLRDRTVGQERITASP